MSKSRSTLLGQLNGICDLVKEDTTGIVFVTPPKLKRKMSMPKLKRKREVALEQEEVMETGCSCGAQMTNDPRHVCVNGHGVVLLKNISVCHLLYRLLLYAV